MQHSILGLTAERTGSRHVAAPWTQPNSSTVCRCDVSFGPRCNRSVQQELRGRPLCLHGRKGKRGGGGYILLVICGTKQLQHLSERHTGSQLAATQYNQYNQCNLTVS